MKSCAYKQQKQSNLRKIQFREVRKDFSNLQRVKFNLPKKRVGNAVLYISCQGT